MFLGNVFFFPVSDNFLSLPFFPHCRVRSFPLLHFWTRAPAEKRGAAGCLELLLHTDHWFHWLWPSFSGTEGRTMPKYANTYAYTAHHTHSSYSCRNGRGTVWTRESLKGAQQERKNNLMGRGKKEYGLVSGRRKEQAEKKQ